MKTVLCALMTIVLLQTGLEFVSAGAPVIPPSVYVPIGAIVSASAEVQSCSLLFKKIYKYIFPETTVTSVWEAI